MQYIRLVEVFLRESGNARRGKVGDEGAGACEDAKRTVRLR